MVRVKPEERLAEAIKQVEVVIEDHERDARTQLDLITAVHDLEKAKARYELDPESDDSPEVVE